MEEHMSEKKIMAMTNVVTPNQPVIFDPDVCTGCNNCVETCQIDVYIPHPVKGNPPIILHPDECWYCGCCANDCPTEGAMKFNWPLQSRPYWKNKETGKIGQI